MSKKTELRSPPERQVRWRVTHKDGYVLTWAKTAMEAYKLSAVPVPFSETKCEILQTWRKNADV